MGEGGHCILYIWGSHGHQEVPFGGTYHLLKQVRRKEAWLAAFLLGP